LADFLAPGWVYHNIVWKYALETGITAGWTACATHSLRATAAAHTLSHEAHIDKAQE
jgi:hypothetical protein